MLSLSPLRCFWKRGNIFKIYKQQKNEGKCPPFGLFKAGREQIWPRVTGIKRRLCFLAQEKDAQGLLEFPREASPVASLNSNLCECVKGLLLGSHSVGAPQGGTPHSKPAQDNAEPSPAERGGSQEAF